VHYMLPADTVAIGVRKQVTAQVGSYLLPAANCQQPAVNTGSPCMPLLLHPPAQRP
jgi:hypothetical protein